MWDKIIFWLWLYAIILAEIGVIIGIVELARLL